MSDIETIVAGIEAKAKLLLEENARLRASEESLRGQLTDLQRQMNEINSSIITLKEENRLLKLGEKLTQKGDTTEMKLKINQLIRSIDRSLAIINTAGTETERQP